MDFPRRDMVGDAFKNSELHFGMQIV